jgi:hypothetical protein
LEKEGSNYFAGKIKGIGNPLAEKREQV